MLQGVCIDNSQTTVLEKGKSYFLFPNGAHHYYVSIFPNQSAHKGCFQSRYFQIIKKEEWPQEPEIKLLNLDPEKLYKAKLIWRKPGYKMVALKEYWIKPSKTHGDFYHDRELEKLGGSFPLHWFEDFEKVEFEKKVTKTIDFVIKPEENVHFPTEIEPKTIKYVQLSLFD